MDMSLPGEQHLEDCIMLTVKFRDGSFLWFGEQNIIGFYVQIIKH